MAGGGLRTELYHHAGPGTPVPRLHRIYLNSGCRINVVVAAAHDPKLPFLALHMQNA
jgi:hypothetical protein